MKHKKRNKISDHFSNRDFVCNCGLCQKSLRISLGLVGGLELLRFLAKQRINIIKGYVCPEHAEKLDKIKKNYHTMGIAADITIDNKSLKETFLLAEQVSEFKGIGLNLTEKYVHVDTRKEKDPILWVVDGNKKIDLTPENRDQYFEKL
jgi:hypothetical protein